MGNINYEKAEKEVAKAVQNTTVKNLVEGKTIKSARAMDFFGIKEEEARPQPQDRVARLMSEIAASDEDDEIENVKRAERAKKEKEAAEKLTGMPPSPPKEQPEEEEDNDEGIEVEAEFETLMKIPDIDTLKKARRQSDRTPKPLPLKSQSVDPSEKFHEPASPLLILRKHILWFKRLHMDDRYERLGTTQEEVFTFRRAERLSEKDLLRIQELNKRATELKHEILKKHGKSTLEGMIENEKFKNKRKRLHSRDSWIAL